MSDPNILIRKLKDREENPDKWSPAKEYAMRTAPDYRRADDAVKGVIVDRCKIRVQGSDLPGKEREIICRQADEDGHFFACDPQICEVCTNPARKIKKEDKPSS